MQRFADEKYRGPKGGIVLGSINNLKFHSSNINQVTHHAQLFYIWSAVMVKNTAAATATAASYLR
jgi:hypothetical protein